MDKEYYKKIWTWAQLRRASIKIFWESGGLKKGQVDACQGESEKKMILIELNRRKETLLPQHWIPCEKRGEGQKGHLTPLLYSFRSLPNLLLQGFSKRGFDWELMSGERRGGRRGDLGATPLSVATARRICHRRHLRHHLPLSEGRKEPTSH